MVTTWRKCEKILQEVCIRRNGVLKLCYLCPLIFGAVNFFYHFTQRLSLHKARYLRFSAWPLKSPSSNPQNPFLKNCPKQWGPKVLVRKTHAMLELSFLDLYSPVFDWPDDWILFVFLTGVGHFPGGFVCHSRGREHCSLRQRHHPRPPALPDSGVHWGKPNPHDAGTF